jgi:hypothetical protein
MTMGLKKEELEEGCFAHAADDEPMFVLLGRDKLAPELVRRWADRAEKFGARPEKVAKARETADRMENYHTRKLPD